MKRLVLDTNVTLSALLWKGTCRQVLDAVRQGGFRLYTSPPLLDGLTDVLSRPKFNRKVLNSGLTVDQLLRSYTALANTLHPVSIPATARDVDDDAVLGTALAARAHLVVSGDADLLDLGTFQTIPIITAAQALHRFLT